MTTIDHRTPQQYVTDDKCKALREACPGPKNHKVTWAAVSSAVAFAALGALVIAGCWGMSYEAFATGAETNAKLDSHMSAQEVRDEHIVKSLDEIKATLDKMHPREGE